MADGHKYGLYIPSTKGSKKRTYMIAFIDDAIRLVCPIEFYDNQRLPILEDSFRKAILKYGKPDAVYTDYIPRNIMNSELFEVRYIKKALRDKGVD